MFGAEKRDDFGRILREENRSFQMKIM